MSHTAITISCTASGAIRKVDGRVLVTGGDIEGLGVAASAELYVPDGWSP